jgi:hypothetical protein
MLSDPPKGSLRVAALDLRGLGDQVQFKKSRHRDYGLRVLPVFERGKLDGFSTIDKEAATKTVLIADDPVTAAILAD